MGVPFEELAGSPQIRVGTEGLTAVRMFRVAWDHWQSFLQELVGHYRLVGGQWTFVDPQPFPGMPNLVVQRVEIEPFEPALPDQQILNDPARGLNTYSQSGAKVTAWYENLVEQDPDALGRLPKVPKGTFLTYESRSSLEYVLTSARIWRWDMPDPQPLTSDNAPGVLTPHTLIKLTWHRVPYPPWNAIRALRGHVNATPFLGAPAETVLFTGARIKRQFHFYQRGGFWKVEYYFQETARFLSDGTPVGWNHYFKDTPALGEHWIRIVDDLGRPPYPVADFSNLFVFGYP